MVGHRPEERVRLPAVVQTWEQVTFLHWPVDPEVLRPHVPGGLTLDTRDSKGWLTLVLLRLVGSRAAGIVPLPIGASVPQTNLRTYVRDHRGLDGLWFFTLEVASRPLALAGRWLLGLPYHHASMSVQERPEGTVRYRSDRAGPTGHDVTVEPDTPLPEPPAGTQDEDLASWLTGRWRAFTKLGPLTMTVATQHPPWRLHHATVHHLDQDLFGAVGLPEPAGEPLVHYAARVPVRLGAPRPRRSATGSGAPR